MFFFSYNENQVCQHPIGPSPEQWLRNPFAYTGRWSKRSVEVVVVGGTVVGGDGTVEVVRAGSAVTAFRPSERRDTHARVVRYRRFARNYVRGEQRWKSEKQTRWEEYAGESENDMYHTYTTDQSPLNLRRNNN